MNTPPGAVVLDPFAGAGTTLIEARLGGFSAVGFEVNPFLAFVCEASLNWELDPEALGQDLREIQKTFQQRRRTYSLGVNGLAPPSIHNVNRWWRPDVLTDLLVLHESLRQGSINQGHRRFFELALAGVLVPELTNVTLGRLQLHFINRDRDLIDVWTTFFRHATSMIRDLKQVLRVPSPGPGKVYNVDATALPGECLSLQVDRVVTSPPYPNRYSYVWNTRPHLYFFGFFRSAKEAGDLDLKTIGGTWGTATSSLLKGRLDAKFPAVKRVVTHVADEIRATDNLMANYLTKYFNQLCAQIMAQQPLLKPGARLAYVVGCSWLKGIYIETDVMLAKLFDSLGYNVEGVERFRRRHSGKDLHESIVYVRAA
jgi:hypothetical protein